MGVRTGNPLSLVEFSARKAFWQIELPLLEKFAREELDLRLWGTAAEKVFMLIQAILKCSDEEAADILEQRCGTFVDDAAHADLLQSAEAEDCMDHDEQKTVEKIVEQTSRKKAAADDIMVLLRAKRAASRKGKAKTAKPASSTASASAPPAKKLRKATLDKWPDDVPELTISLAQDLCPPGCRLYKDTFNCCWRMFVGTKQARSLSWGRRGHAACQKELARWAWQEHQARTGEACWVQGLMT
jgi:hypothetical protein